MSFMKDKKGLAEVVLVVLIILLAIASITIFSAALLGPVQQLSPQLSCTELRIEKPFEFKKACIQDGELQVTLQRPLSNLDISKVVFRASNPAGDTEEWCCGGTQCPECLIQDSGATKTYSLPGVKIQDSKLLVIDVDQCVLESTEITAC